MSSSSRNAPLWEGALRDDTKNGCVTHLVHTNPDKNVLFQKCPDSGGHGLSLAGRFSFEAYLGTHTSAFPVHPAGSECRGTLWVVAPSCIVNPCKEAVAHYKSRRLHRQHPGLT